MPETPTTRHTVFISYSHADKRYLDELLLHLEPLRREGNVRLWVDTMLKAGDTWREEIAHALASARVAIVLVSAAFRASKFIAENELPPLLAAAKSEGVLILPVFVGACDYHDSDLAGVQAVNDPERPLSRMPKPRREGEWVKVARRVKDVFAASQGQRQMNAPISSAPEQNSAQAPLMLSSRDEPGAEMLAKVLRAPIPDLTPSAQVASGEDNGHPEGWDLLIQERYADALVTFVRELTLDPDYARGWTGLGEALRNLERRDEAIAAYDQALVLDPNTAFTWLGMAWALTDLERYALALAAYEQAVILDPNNANMWEAKRDALRELGRDEEADEADKRVRELRGSATASPSPSERPVTAPEGADTATRLAPPPHPSPAPAPAESVDDLIKRGIILYEFDRNYVEAVAAFERALELEPDNADTWVRKGDALVELERDTEALTAYERALELDPGNGEAWSSINLTLRALGRGDEVRAARQKMLEVNSTEAALTLSTERSVADPEKPARDLDVPPRGYMPTPAPTIKEQVGYIVWMYKGRDLLNTHSNAEALDAFNQALALDPNSVEAWFGKGETLRDLGRYGEAQAAFHRATELRQKQKQ